MVEKKLDKPLKTQKKKDSEWSRYIEGLKKQEQEFYEEHPVWLFKVKCS